MTMRATDPGPMPDPVPPVVPDEQVPPPPFKEPPPGGLPDEVPVPNPDERNPPLVVRPQPVQPAV